jgi:hypothetical protein|tara:strand:+ start:779 stop:982 length:204 start_codon:yes stop_codon:yes gene_type:complete
MSISDEELLFMMHENAALSNLEAEVILAIKANAVADTTMLEEQIGKIIMCLEHIDNIRKRYDPRSKS